MDFVPGSVILMGYERADETAEPSFGDLPGLEASFSTRGFPGRNPLRIISADTEAASLPQEDGAQFGVLLKLNSAGSRAAGAEVHQDPVDLRTHCRYPSPCTAHRTVWLLSLQGWLPPRTL